MDNVSPWPAPGLDNSNSPISKRPRPPQKEFQRAYKACVSCRKRKSRCEITAEEYSANLPCSRCRRELKECIFTEDRPTKARKIASASRAGGDEAGAIASPTGSDERNGFNHEGQGITPHPRRAVSVGVTASPGDPTDSILRTVVSSGNDALNLLFEAAHHHDASTTATRRVGSQRASELNSTPIRRLPNVDPDVLRLWSACRFVKMGWLSAPEAIYLLDAFYETLSPLSPILTDFYRKPENHRHLLTQEPMLCSTILCISARYNMLPSSGGKSRTFHIHERLWEYCQRIILRIILGQERGAAAKTRTLGTVEALLLWTEWHPRALHFPPDHDGWDSDLLLVANVDDISDQQDEVEELDSKERWLEDVVNPAKRSDRMSWMLAGSALSLAHELAVFEEEKDANLPAHSGRQPGWERVAEQRYRLRKLVYLYIEQLSFRLGCKTLITSSLARAVGPAKSPTTWALRSPESWQAFIAAQIDLTKTLKSAADVLFPSPSTTKSLLQSGRYATLIEHFSPLLLAFRDKHLRLDTLGPRYLDALAIEYHHARIYLNSLGVQAIVERIIAEVPPAMPFQRPPASSLDGTDFRFIQEVVDGSLAILDLAVKLANSNTLLFSPVRIFLRIISASMLLLKGLSLGVSSTKLTASLNTLERAITALRAGSLDDIHLGSRYALLLEMHVNRLRSCFVPSTKPADIPSSLGPQGETLDNGGERADGAIGAQLELPIDSGFSGANRFTDMDDWLTLPFDPSLVPFPNDDAQGFSWLTDGMMDFVWNLDTSDRQLTM